MSTFQLVAIVLTLTAGLAFVNAKFLKLPSTVGLMAIALVGSLALLGLDQLGWIDVSTHVRPVVADLDFGDTLLHGMLGLLLFAGALHIDLADLGADKLAVAALALGGTLISTILVGLGTYVLLSLLGMPITPIEAFLFGALISPTDPIAVLGVLKSANAPHELEVRIAGESLFNDGIGVVIFTTVLAIAAGHDVTAGGVIGLFLREAVGGCLFGLAAGWVAIRLIRAIDDYTVEVMLTLALVVGGYATAEALHISAPLAAIVAGLVIGNHGRRIEKFDMLWKLIDEILNAVLFMMIGLTILILPVHAHLAAAALGAIPLVLLARWVSVATPLTVLRPFRSASPHSIKILTWGGLRGGLSIAMALSLPPSDARDVTLAMTYAVVAFSILAQGLSFAPFLRRLERRGLSR